MALALGMEPFEGVLYLLLSIALAWSFASFLVSVPFGLFVWRNYSQENLRKLDYAATRVVRLWKRFPLPRDPVYSTFLSTLAFVRSCLGRMDESCKLYYEALAVMSKPRYKRMAYPHLATVLNNIAGIHSREHNFDEANRLLDQSLAIWEAQKGREKNGAAIPYTNKAHILIEQGQLDEAEKLLLKARSLYEDPEQPRLIVQDTVKQARIICLLELVDLSCRKGKPAEARSYVEEALGVIASVSVPPGPQLLRSLNSASASLLALEEVDVCARLLAMAYDIGRLFPDHPDAQRTLEVFEGLLTKTSRQSEISDMKRWLLPV